MSKLHKNFFPDEKTLTEIREKFSKPDYPELSVALAEDASEVEHAKYEVCQLIARYQRESGLRQDDLASMMGVDKARVSEIIRGKIGHFTLDRLLDYSQRLIPKMKIQIRIAA